MELSNPSVTMSNEEPVPYVEEEVDGVEHGKCVGLCKWFNKRLGYGFITVYEGDNKGTNLFVHHTGIRPLNSNFRTLRKGEYVSLDIEQGKNGVQAINVTGVYGGPLMCDNLFHNKFNLPSK